MKFRNDTEIKEAFEEAFNDKGVATQEKVDAAVKAVMTQATEEFGPQGLYVSGVLNSDMQCVSFQFKRPGVSQRVQHTIACQVPVPKGDQDAKFEDTVHVDASNDDDNNPGSTEDRLSMFQDLTALMKEDDLTREGKPKLEALNALLKPEEEPFTASERDELWES